MDYFLYVFSNASLFYRAAVTWTCEGGIAPASPDNDTTKMQTATEKQITFLMKQASNE